jgi:hypothetical protein
MHDADAGHPGGCCWWKLRKPSNLAGRDCHRQKADNADRDAHGHALARRAGDDAAPCCGVVQRECGSRQQREDSSEHAD